MAANEVENLRPVFPWQHLTLSASPVCCSGCSVVLWLISSFQALQEDKSTFDMPDTAGYAHMHTQTHTHTHSNGWHAVPHLHTGWVKMCSGEEKLQQANCRSTSRSTWHPTDFILQQINRSIRFMCQGTWDFNSINSLAELYVVVIFGFILSLSMHHIAAYSIAA